VTVIRTFGTGAVDAYEVLGGSVGGGFSFNPATGQLSIAADLGSGLGFGLGACTEVGKTGGIGNPSLESAP